MLCSVPVVWSFSASLIQRKAEAGTEQGDRVTLSLQHVKPLYPGPECHRGLNGSSAEGYG